MCQQEMSFAVFIDAINKQKIVILSFEFFDFDYFEFHDSMKQTKKKINKSKKKIRMYEHVFVI